MSRTCRRDQGHDAGQELLAVVLDAQRLSEGIPGNFTLEEAIFLAQQTGVGFLIPHHFGMFSFNTCDPAEIDRFAKATSRPTILRPLAGEMLRIG